MEKYTLEYYEAGELQREEFADVVSALRSYRIVLEHPSCHDVRLHLEEFEEEGYDGYR